MNVSNLHKREIRQSKIEVVKLFSTLATDNDMIIATRKWPRMKLDRGLEIGSKGGHGPIKYFVTEYQSDHYITFKFDMIGFNGFHRFEIIELEPYKTEVSHVLSVTTTGLASLKWAMAIRWLHDAYIEDAFDNIENHFLDDKKRGGWSFWVRTLRKMIKLNRALATKI